MDPFWQEFRMIVFFMFPIMNLGALIRWKHFCYEDKALRTNEAKRKRSNRRNLIVLLIICNALPVYMLLTLIYGSFW